jgi:hypothetical protein
MTILERIAAWIYLFGLGLVMSAAVIVDVVIALVYWSAAS